MKEPPDKNHNVIAFPGKSSAAAKKHASIRQTGHVKRAVGALVILAAGLGLFWFLDYYVTATHLAELPQGFVATETERFEVFYAPETEEQKRRMVEAGEVFIDRFASRYGEAFGGLKPPSNRIRLTLFRNHTEFKQFARSTLRMDLSNNGGYCDAANQEIVLVLSKVGHDFSGIMGSQHSPDRPGLDMPSREEADVMAMRHELVHYMIERGGGDFGSQAAPWLSEGLAGIFEMPDPGDGNPPELAVWAQVILATTSKPLPIKTIVTATPEAFRGASNLVIYSFSSLLVRFLWREDKQTLFSYVRAMRDGEKAGWNRFKSHFEFNGEMSKRWVRMISTLQQEARRVIRRAHPPMWRSPSL